MSVSATVISAYSPMECPVEAYIIISDRNP